MTTSFDDPGEQFVEIALSINTHYPGYVSEYWGNQDLKKQIERNPIPSQLLLGFINAFEQTCNSIQDQRRKQYLLAHATAFKAITQELNGNQLPINDFLQKTTGHKLSPVDEDIITDLKTIITQHANRSNSLPRELFIAPIVEEKDLISYIDKLSTDINTTIEDVLGVNIPKSFTIETQKQVPWGAFNHHIAPFTSKVEINTSLTLNRFDVKYLLIHEILGGHHTELSLKDTLLTEHNRKEHSLITVFSPQTFISEGIAESACEIFNLISSKSEHESLFLFFKALYNMMQHNAVFYIHNQGWNEEKLRKYFSDGDFWDEKEVNATISFLTDPVWGRYAAWYYPAKQLILRAYNQAQDKQAFLQSIYTQPTTPHMLTNTPS